MQSAGEAHPWSFPSSEPGLPFTPLGEGDHAHRCYSETLRPHGHQTAVLPLQHVVLDAFVCVLSVGAKLDTPTIEHAAYGDIQAQRGSADLIGVEIATGLLQDFRQNPHACGTQLR